MAHQYFEDNEALEHELQDVQLNLATANLTLTTDSGVFSRQRVDYGTLVLLKAVLPIIKARASQAISILDVGCGYGPIGLSLAKLFPDATVTMVDVNERALDLARDNAIKNQVADQVTILKSNAYSALAETQKFDFIITNPPIRAGKKVVDDILLTSQKFLTEEGSFFAVLQKKQGAPSAKKNLATVYPNVEVIKRDKGYYILQAKSVF
ncbi:class I SAM-dependent methyltransferase [Lapidilactobacillus dextrinicus]|uniref:class I SAM-dependent methyltransferase n=1 Tax=Lapidilactobacillus dextrinicus TaxID=51664 RepID=UPI0022E32B45|nr:methyltransferase [Lapidilactobacillus dextrinicus]